MPRKGDICYTGCLDDSKNKVVCSVVSIDKSSATVRLWDTNKIVKIPFSGGKYVQRVKSGPKSACAKRYLGNKVYANMSDAALQEHLGARLSQQQLSKTKTNKPGGGY